MRESVFDETVVFPEGSPVSEVTSGLTVSFLTGEQDGIPVVSLDLDGGENDYVSPELALQFLKEAHALVGRALAELERRVVCNESS